MKTHVVLILFCCLYSFLISCNSNAVSDNTIVEDTKQFEIEELLNKERSLNLTEGILVNVDSVAGFHSLVLGINLKDIRLTYHDKLDTSELGIVRIICNQRIKDIDGLNLCFVDSILCGLRFTPPNYISYGVHDTTYLFALKLKFGNPNIRNFEDVSPYEYKRGSFDSVTNSWVENAYKRKAIWKSSKITLEYSKDSIVGTSSMAEYDDKSGFHYGKFTRTSYEFFMYFNDFEEKCNNQRRVNDALKKQKNELIQNEDREKILKNH